MDKDKHDEKIDAEIKVRQVAPELSEAEIKVAVKFEILRRKQEKENQIKWGLSDGRNELSKLAKGKGRPKGQSHASYITKVMNIVIVMWAMEQYGCATLADAKRQVARVCKAKGITDKKGQAVDYDKVNSDFKNAKATGFWDIAWAFLFICREDDPNFSWTDLARALRRMISQADELQDQYGNILNPVDDPVIISLK
jgi:hypothetical protein